jgi:hypothetical protein
MRPARKSVAPAQQPEFPIKKEIPHRMSQPKMKFIQKIED